MSTSLHFKISFTELRELLSDLLKSIPLILKSKLLVDLSDKTQAKIVAVMIAVLAQLISSNISEKTDTIKPHEYPGGSDYVDFKYKVQLYLTTNNSKFKTGKNKILFTLLYLKGGYVTV